MKVLKIIGVVLAIMVIMGLVMFNFFMADLRTDNIASGNQSYEKIEFAKNILNEAIKQQGLDSLSKFSTYEVIGRDHWKGTMGEMGNPWGWNNDKMSMRFATGDFDGQVEVLEGDQKGFSAGIQSWTYYEKKENSVKSDVVTNDGITFTLAAFHYFFELGPRLAKAPMVRYAGEDIFNGQKVHKVFASWGNEVTKEYDQYILWVGQESKLIEATSFTTRDSPKPAPLFMYGSLRFDDYRNIDGVMIPFVQTAQMMNPKEDLEDYIHKLTIESFKWDNFDKAELRPLKMDNKYGDGKPSK